MICRKQEFFGKPIHLNSREYGVRRRLQVLHSVMQPENKVICNIGFGVGGFSFALLESKPKFIIRID